MANTKVRPHFYHYAESRVQSRQVKSLLSTLSRNKWVIAVLWTQVKEQGRAMEAGASYYIYIKHLPAPRVAPHTETSREHVCYMRH